MRLTTLCLAVTVILTSNNWAGAGTMWRYEHGFGFHREKSFDHDPNQYESYPRHTFGYGSFEHDWFPREMFGHRSYWGSLWHGFDLEHIHEHFEDKLADLMAEFDVQSTEDPNYTMTDPFDEFVDDVQRLFDRHEQLLHKVAYSIERIGDAIVRAEEKIGQFAEKVQDWLGRDDLPEKWQMWIVDHAAWLEEHLSMKIDKLVDKQTMLLDDQTMYQMFQDDLQIYLDELLSLDGSMLGESMLDEGNPETMVELLTTLATTDSLESTELIVESLPQGGFATTAAATAVPEPTTATLALILAAIGWCYGCKGLRY